MEAELGALRQRLSQAEAQLAEEARRSREAAARTRELETAEQARRPENRRRCLHIATSMLEDALTYPRVC